MKEKDEMNQTWKRLIIGCLLIAGAAAHVFSAGKQEKDTYFEYRGLMSVEAKGLQIFSVEITGERDRNRDGLCRMEIISPDNSRFKVRHDMRNGDLKIWVKDTHILFGHKRGPHRIVLYVPTELEVYADADSGSVYIEGIEGEIEARADSGSVDLKSLSGNLTASSDSGSISASSITGVVDMDVDSGNIDISESRGDFTFRGDSGSVRMRRVSGRFFVDTDSGSIEASKLYLDEDSSFSADSGSVSISLDNRREDLSVKASADSGKITVFSVSGSRLLEWGSGSTGLEIETDSGKIIVK